jgi:hypothetical protein
MPTHKKKSKYQIHQSEKSGANQSVARCMQTTYFSNRSTHKILNKRQVVETLRAPVGPVSHDVLLQVNGTIWSKRIWQSQSQWTNLAE